MTGTSDGRHGTTTGDDHIQATSGPVGERAARPRERILDIALDLFTEHGYDKTSLREIADELGFTKAALYYHFEHKKDILLALHLRLHALGHDALGRLGEVEATEENLGVWSVLLDSFIDQILANRKLFLFHLRNQNALDQIAHDEHDLEHQDMEQELRRFLGSPALPAAVRVRMACSIGAVMGAIMGSGEVFADVGSDELARLVRGAVHDLLDPVRPPTRPDRGRRPPRSPHPPRSPRPPRTVWR